MTRKDKGGLGEADAIRYYTALGATVSIPFTPAAYDLVAEKDGRFKRVQCKYAGRYKGYSYNLKVTRKKRNGESEPIDSNFDELFVLTGDGSRYIVPQTHIVGKTEISLSSQFRVEDSFCPENPKDDLSCKRCGRPNDTNGAVCSECRVKTAEYQRRYRERKKNDK